MNVTSASEVILGLAREAFEEYSGGHGHYEDDTEATTLTIGANEVRCGHAEDLHTDLLRIAKDEGQDFAWYVYEDPAYEWLGQVWVHVPGFEDFHSDCDADGGTVLTEQTINRILDGDGDIRTELEIAIGRPQTHAFAMYTGDVTVTSPLSPANNEEADR
jgi:hypothetical protein